MKLKILIVFSVLGLFIVAAGAANAQSDDEAEQRPQQGIIPLSNTPEAMPAEENDEGSVESDAKPAPTKAPENNSQPIEKPAADEFEDYVYDEPVDVQDVASARQKITPDLVELVVELDPKTYAYRARQHTMIAFLNADFLIVGRVNAGMHFKLSDYFTITVPLYFEEQALASSLGVTLGIKNADIRRFWGAGIGVGLKIRLSEWFLKSSIFVEPLVAAGYYSQNATLDAEGVFRRAIRIRPALYLGVQTIFDTGLLVEAKLGVERPIDISLGEPLVVQPTFTVSPLIGLGYAW